jgi:hypothetical protein
MAKNEVIPKVCSSSSMIESFKHGVTYQYVYSDLNRSQLGSFTVTGADCK